MSIRTPENWRAILAALPSPDGIPVEQVAAQRILSDLMSYRWHGKDRPTDAVQLGNALAAWAALVAEPQP